MQVISRDDFFARLEEQFRHQYPAALAKRLLPFAHKLFDLFPLEEFAASGKGEG